MKYNLTQYTLIATIALLTACSSSSNDGNEPGATSDTADTPSDASTAEDPGSDESPDNDTATDNPATGDQPASNDPGNENTPAPNTSDPDSADPDSAAAITMDNHVELLNFVFAIYSGHKQGSEILALPAYPDSAFDDSSIADGSPSDESRSPEVVQDIVCSNGGTLVHTQDSWYSQQNRANRKISNFVFDNCQQESTIFDGELLRDMLYGVLELESSGLTTVTQSLDTSFSGDVRYQYAETRSIPTLSYSLDNVQYAVTSATDGLFELKDANFYYGTREGYLWKQLTGGFSVTAPETGNQQLVVSVPESLEYNGDYDNPESVQNFQTGSMQITAENGDTLTLNADTGNDETVKIDIQNGDVIDSVEQPWSTWQDSLEYRLDLAPPIDCSIPALQDLCNP